MLCHKLRPNKATNIQSVLGLYIYQGGARRRVLDTLCHFDLTMSYTTLQRRMLSLIKEAERKVQMLGQGSNMNLTYDNFDFAEGKRGERTGDNRDVRSITTALIFQGQGFDAGALRQDMWRPATHLLSAERIARKLETGDLEMRVSSIQDEMYIPRSTANAPRT